MRAIDPELQARLDSGATSLCRCWRVRRRDGVELGFTDHDLDLNFGGLIYRAGTGMDPGTVQAGTGLGVDNGQAVGALSAAAVREEDIAAGRYDGAEVWHWLVDWEKPALRVLLFRGGFGEIRRADGAFEVELRGLAEALNAPVGRTLMRTCDRVLGDDRCGFDANQPGFSGEGRVEPGSESGTLAVSGLGDFAGGWFEHGLLTWLTGENTGAIGMVKSDWKRTGLPRRLELWVAPARPVAEGDRFRIVAGCDKQAETCRTKFSNFLNFRGFPHIPGDDWVTAYPKDGAIHDGASRNYR